MSHDAPASNSPAPGAPSRIPRVAWAFAFAAAAALLVLGWFNLKSIRREAAGPTLPVLATAPDFAFTSQTGARVTKADLAGKIWIADFIFTRCAGPCPQMTDRMSELQRKLGRANDVRLVTVTVDPAHDQPAVLARYGERFGADPERWNFLTGDLPDIERFSTKGMLLALAKDEQGLPMHAQKFVVVDQAGQIRAYHDLSDPMLIPRLLTDIESLRRENPAPAATPAP